MINILVFRRIEMSYILVKCDFLIHYISGTIDVDILNEHNTLYVPNEKLFIKGGWLLLLLFLFVFLTMPNTCHAILKCPYYMQLLKQIQICPF